MKVTQKVKKALSGSFNVLAGKKGSNAKLHGYGVVLNVAVGGALTGLAVVTGGSVIPVLAAGLCAYGATMNGLTAHNYSKKYDQKNGPSL